MQIAFFEVEDWEKEYFQKETTGQTLMFDDKPLTADNANSYSNAEVLVVFVHSQVTAEVIAKLPNVKFIATRSTGYDHIDLTACQARNIAVSNVPTYGEATVAEHAFALLLAISRRIVESVERARRGQFVPKGLTGFELRAKTLGVVGVGNIGTNVIKIAKGFGMNVIAYKRTPDHILEKQLGFSFVDLKVLCAQSDVISLHLPYSKETHHFINEEAFSNMKEGVIIINTARGGLIDSTALLRALESGKVKAAGLDVLEEEPLLQEESELLSKNIDQAKLLTVLEDHMLVNHPNVIITPHNAFNSNEALKKIIETTHENINAFVMNAPVNVVAATP